MCLARDLDSSTAANKWYLLAPYQALQTRPQAESVSGSEWQWSMIWSVTSGGRQEEGMNSDRERTNDLFLTFYTDDKTLFAPNERTGYPIYVQN